MNKTVTIDWDVEDGYCGGSPQHLEIDLDEFDGLETEREILDVIHALVQEDFEYKVSWSVDNEDEVVELVTMHNDAKPRG